MSSAQLPELLDPAVDDEADHPEDHQGQSDDDPDHRPVPVPPLGSPNPKLVSQSVAC
jgi:hypothetical protein